MKIRLALLLVVFHFGVLSKSEIGVTDNEILIGTSFSLTGEVNPRALEVKRGIDVYVAGVNAKGGVHGRKIKLLTADDKYLPLLALENAINQVEKDKVFGLMAYFGAANGKAVLPYIVEKASQVPFMGPISGSESLRTPVKKNIFNIRPGFYQEAESLVELFHDKLGFTDFSVFFQDDAFGQESKAGLQKALSKRNLKLKSEGGYDKKNQNIDLAYQNIEKGKPQVVMLAGTFNKSAEFAKRAHAEKKGWKFMGTTTISSTNFIKEGGEAVEGVQFAGAFPPLNSSLKIIQDFHKDEKASGEKEVISFEGYLTAAVFVEALKNCGRDLTREKLFAVLEQMNNQDFGGIKISFSKDDHQGMKDAYYSTIKAGAFVPLEK